MTAEAGAFTRWCVEEYLGTRAAPALEAALRHRTSLLRAGIRPVEPPRRLLEGAPAEPTWAGTRLSVDPGAVLSLERDAAGARVTVDRMLTHAFFVYLSALDSGEPG